LNNYFILCIIFSTQICIRKGFTSGQRNGWEFWTRSIY